MYATPADVIARYPNRDLVQLTNEDPSATTVDESRVTQALDDASAEIDGYLEGRFKLPLGDPPAVLKRVAVDIAIYRLQALRPLQDIEEARKRYEDARDLLVRVSKGQVTLGLSAGGGAAPVEEPVHTVEGPERIFTRDRLKGF